MFNQGFTVSGSSLKLLKPGERGVVARLSHANDTITRKLQALGISKGTTIVVEERFPRFVIRVGCHRHAIDERVMNAIYVRVSSRSSLTTASAPLTSPQLSEMNL